MKFWVIISLLLAAAVARAGEPIPGRGAALYAARCAFCHGPTGHGNGPSGRTMKPRPTDFTSGPGARLTPDRVRAAIVQGDRKSTRLNSSHITRSRMPSSA